MSLNPSPTSPFATALIETLGVKYSHSRKPRDGFAAWQEHVRKSAGSLSSAPPARRDRDLRRTVVPG